MYKWLLALFEDIDKMYEYFGHYFVKVILTFHILYFAVIFGIISINVGYLNAFNIFIHSLVCLFLIFRFNPLREKNRLKDHDSDIIFSSSLFLLLNLGVVEGIKKFFPNYDKDIKELKSLI